MQENKLSFLYSERFFKKGVWRRFIPSTRKAVKERILKYKNNEMYVLCASAYLPYDLELIGFPSEKCFKWGYFPECKKHDDVDALIASKKKNSLLWCGRLIDLKHPELAIEGSIERSELVEMISRLKELGLNIIPKLNFSTCHDGWLKDYSKMVSTKAYYDVCRDLINEVCDVFNPEIIHIGMDEENYENQRLYDYVVIRQNDLWWHDLLYLVELIEKRGARACMWSDYARHRPDEFIEKCPKSVIQCPWYYFNKFDGDLTEAERIRVEPFVRLAEAGYTIIAGGSNEYFDDNVSLLDSFCKKHIPADKYTGIIQTTWASTTAAYRKTIFDAAELMKDI
jgi:hypothetical protein